MTQENPLPVEASPAPPILMAYVGLFVTMVVWSIVPVFLKKLLAVLSPTELSFTRFLLTGTGVLAWVLVRQRRELVRLFREDFRLLILCTVFGPLAAMVCFNFGILHVTVGTAAVFSAVEPLATYVMAVMIGQEVWRRSRMFSILLALAGIVLVILSRVSWGVAYWISLVLVLLTPIIWAANNIISKEIVKCHSPVVMMSASFFLSSLLLVPTLGRDMLARLSVMDGTLWLGLAYCVMATVFGFTVWYWSLKHLAPSTVAVSMYVIPVFSVAAGMAFLGEPMSWPKGTGIAVVLLGLYLVNVRFR